MDELISDREPVARKVHRCDDCGRGIQPGETYRRMVMVGDYGPRTWKRCAHCRVFIAMYFDEFADCDDTYSDTSIRDWEPETPEAIEHKRGWVVKWRNDAGLYPVPTRSEAGA